MNLIGEEFIPSKQEKTKKTSKWLLIAIAVVVVLIILIIILISSMKQEPLKVLVDGNSNSDVKALLKFQEDGKVYIPIKEIAPFLQYAAYNGDYTSKSEENNKCYIEIEDEAVVFTVNSNKIEKIDKHTNESTYYTIDEPITFLDGKLVTTPEGMKKAFNVYFNYDANKKKVVINTLQYVVDMYAQAAVNFGFDEISKDFSDSKASLEGLVIVKKSRTKYGLFDMNTEKEILEAKYDSISYIPYANQFIVTSNGAMGIKDSSGNDIIKMQYEEIEKISQEFNLYVVKKDGKYGIIDDSEKTVIPPVLDKIGMDIKKYSKNNVKNKYVLLDNFVPVMKNNRWALFTIKGKQLTNLNYESFGSSISNSSNSDALGVLVIPNYNIVIGLRDKKYYLIDENGKELGNGIGFDKVYMEIELNNPKYYVTRNNATADALQVIERLGGVAKDTSKSESGTEENSPEISAPDRSEPEENEQEEESEEEQQEPEEPEESEDEEPEEDEQEDEENEDEENEDKENEDEENEEGETEEEEMGEDEPEEE